MAQAPPPSKAVRNSWLLLAVLAAALFLLVWLRPLDSLLHTSAASHTAVGQSVPSVLLDPLVGTATPINLAELKGQVVLVNFWGTWCPPCREELPHLAEIARQLTRDDFRLVAISCAGGATPEDLDSLATATSEYLSRTKLEISAYADAQGRLREELQKLGAFNDAFPTTLVLDRQGVIRAVWEGYLPGSERDMERVIANLLVQ